MAGAPRMKFAIVGNAGSGKSTLAQKLALRHGVPMLDLDLVAFVPGEIAQPRDAGEARTMVEAFCRQHVGWIIEGCYANLIAACLPWLPKLILLDPGEQQCLANCRSRPWEPHKYPTPEQQQEKLPFLLEWVSGYYQRDGDLSLRGHLALLAGYSGAGIHLRSVPETDAEFDAMTGSE
ncbi:MAG: shikimate kinase [Gammaproteobacteria bacterium]|nr:shikimate kinase [Gammaproteobacteria bacterium]